MFKKSKALKIFSILLLVSIIFAGFICSKTFILNTNPVVGLKANTTSTVSSLDRVFVKNKSYIAYIIKLSNSQTEPSNSSLKNELIFSGLHIKYPSYLNSIKSTDNTVTLSYKNDLKLSVSKLPISKKNELQNQPKPVQTNTAYLNYFVVDSFIYKVSAICLNPDYYFLNFPSEISKNIE